MDNDDDSINKKVKLMPTKSNRMKLFCSWYKIEQPLKLGLLQRALVSAIFAIVQKMNAVHFSYEIDALLQSYEPSCHFVFVAKRLKYAKDILHQLFQGGKGQTGNGGPM
jgi:hypothetical protein